MKKHSFGHHYSRAHASYIADAHKLLEEFILDELGEAYHKQLRYEAACTSLKKLGEKIEAMEEGKARRQSQLFYDQKRRQLEEEAANYEVTPYTL